MTHRAGQIIDRVAQILEADATLGATVLPHRELTLSDPDGELPAVCVRMSTDDGAEFKSTVLIESRLEVLTCCYAQAATEPLLMAELLRLRAAAHRAMLADRTLGLSFVHQVTYLGALEPSIAGEGSRMAGRLDGRFLVSYQMNFSDPE